MTEPIDLAALKWKMLDAANTLTAYCECAGTFRSGCYVCHAQAVLRQAASDLIDTVEQKDAALRAHGEHDSDCGMFSAAPYRENPYWHEGDELVCTCGLGAALALTRTEGGA